MGKDYNPTTGLSEGYLIIQVTEPYMMNPKVTTPCHKMVKKVATIEEAMKFLEENAKGGNGFIIQPAFWK